MLSKFIRDRATAIRLNGGDAGEDGVVYELGLDKDGAIEVAECFVLRDYVRHLRVHWIRNLSADTIVCDGGDVEISTLWFQDFEGGDSEVDFLCGEVDLADFLCFDLVAEAHEFVFEGDLLVFFTSGVYLLDGF